MAPLLPATRQPEAGRVGASPSGGPDADTPRSRVLALDGAGGADLRDVADTSVRIADPDLRALSVEGCASLAALDLGGCPRLRWVGVSGCPSLVRIELPEMAEGVEIQLDAGPAAPRLDVRGPVSWFGCCWTGGVLSLPASTVRRWSPGRGLRVGAWSRDELAGCGLAVVVGRDGGASLDLGGLVGLRAVTVADAPGLRAVTLPDEAVGAHLLRLPDLAEVSGGTAEALRVDDCPSLRRLDASGFGLAVSRSGSGRTIEVGGAWCVLSAPEDGTVLATAPGDGPRTSVGPGGAPAAVAAALRRALVGDEGARRDLLVWCRSVRGGAGALRALECLSALVGAGLDPLEAWRVRGELRERIGAPADRWSWRFPADLADRGWRADADLRIACGLRGGDARLGVGVDPHHVAALLEAFRDACGPPADVAGAELLERLGDPGGGVGADCRPDLRRCVRLLAATADRPAAREIAVAAAGWLRRGPWPAEQRIEALGGLASLGLRAARHALAALACDRGLEEPRRARALAALFVPAASDRLAFPETPAP